MVFWARERTKKIINRAVAEKVAQHNQEWCAWYGRMQVARWEGRPFDEPPPSPPENREGGDFMVIEVKDKNNQRLNQIIAESKARGEAKGRTKGQAQRDREWRAWYELQQRSFREGWLFNEPSPIPPENGNSS